MQLFRIVLKVLSLKMSIERIIELPWQNVHCTATLALSASGQHLTNTLARRRGQAGQRSSQHSGDTSATMDTALYTNLRWIIIIFIIIIILIII